MRERKRERTERSVLSWTFTSVHRSINWKERGKKARRECARALKPVSPRLMGARVIIETAIFIVAIILGRVMSFLQGDRILIDTMLGYARDTGRLVNNPFPIATKESSQVTWKQFRAFWTGRRKSREFCLTMFRRGPVEIWIVLKMWLEKDQLKLNKLANT